MGSAAVIVTDAHLHVGVDENGQWWAVGREGSFGGAPKRLLAIRIAIDAAAQAPFDGRRRIVVHNADGTIAYWILRTKHDTPSAQFFQDDVE